MYSAKHQCYDAVVQHYQHTHKAGMSGGEVDCIAETLSRDYSGDLVKISSAIQCSIHLSGDNCVTKATFRPNAITTSLTTLSFDARCSHRRQ